jgi:hypothetical protein
MTITVDLFTLVNCAHESVIQVAWVNLISFTSVTYDCSLHCYSHKLQLL